MKNLMGIILFMLPATLLCQPAEKQPVQVWNKVKYDVSIKDTFFVKPYYSYEWFMIENADGTFSSTLTDSLGKEIVDTTKNLHTANCITQHQYEHTIRFCSAWYKGDTLMLFVNDLTASTYDNLLIKVVNGKFSSQYWTAYPSFKRSEKLTWTTTSQKLTLNQSSYKSGDELKAKLYIVIKEEQLQNSGKKETTKIMIEGAIKTVIKEVGK